MDLKLQNWLPLSVVEALVPLAAARGVSRVARASGGFLEKYRQARGEPSRLDNMLFSAQKTWVGRRNDFVRRHMAAARKNGEVFWYSDGSPTRRHLALMMWAYSPDLPRMKLWFAALAK